MATNHTTQHSEHQTPQRSRHPDPILSRLLLNDQFGKPIKDPNQHFRDCKVVGFLFSAIWKYDREGFQNHVIELCRRNPHRFKCIYVSIDSSKADFERATRDKPWANMIWEDGSNVEEDKAAQLEDVQFITPLEPELLKRIASGEAVSGPEDGRPVSRVGLCAGVEVLFAPTLMVYHLESRRWLDRNVAHAAIASTEKRETALETWEKGERLTLSWTDIVVGLRWAIMISTIGAIYFILVRSNEAYNIHHLVEWFVAGSPSTTTSPSAPVATPVPQKSAHQYVEF